jgi:AraC-like DNA-binding protein
MALPYSDADLRLAEPAPLTFRYDHVDAHTEFQPHRHPWGQLSRISLGLLEVELGPRKLTAPPEYLVWVPADAEHSAYVRQALEYTSAYLGTAQAARLPDEACLIPLTPVVGALLDDFRLRGVTVVADTWDRRQGELLVEHLVRAGWTDSYLPDSADRQLSAILHAIRLDPGDATTLAEWAERVHSTERTLARRFQRELGMSFVQWRNRVRLLQAFAWLKEDRPVHEIAARLGYGTASAFIAMFRKQVGFAPERYRRQRSG